MTAPPLGRTAADAGPCHAAPDGASGRRDQASGSSRWFRRVACGVAFVAVSVVLLRAQAGGSPSPAKLGQPGKDVSWVPTSEALIQKMFEMAKVKPGDHLVDLGSGDGRTVIAAGKRGVQALGIEYDGNLVELATRAALQEGVSDKTAFVKADLFDADLSSATVITMFLLPEINLKLRPKLLDLAPGTRIVSNTFTMEEWDPDDSRSIGNCASWCTALMWIVPAKVTGTWRLPEGSLTLTQTFQVARGTLATRQGKVAIRDGRLRGTELRFVAGSASYAGQVKGDAIEGIVTTAAGDAPWTATRVKSRTTPPRR